MVDTQNYAAAKQSDVYLWRKRPMEIKGIDDMIEIVDDFGGTYIIDPFAIQSIEIQPGRDTSANAWIRYGVCATEQGYPDCFCIQHTFSSSAAAQTFKEAMYKVLSSCKRRRWEMRR
jgi:hypothetical protein